MLRKVDSSSAFRNRTKFSFAARIITEATTCLATNLNSTLVIGCREARQIKKNKADGEGELEFEVDQ